MNHAQFSSLLPFFEATHDDYLSEHEMNGKRRSNRRSFCIYKNSPLPDVTEHLFFILVYLKNNPLQEYHAASFGMGQKHCNTFVHCLTHILHLSLETMGLMPAQTDKELFQRLCELSREGSEPVLFHDGTEREIPRPVDCDEQKEKYSGKKKRHTVKNAVITTVSCLILFVSQTVSGKMHDKKMADNMYSFPVPCTLYQDTGYQGYAPEGVTIIQPVKKSKGKELSARQKDFNTEVSRIRVRVEHTIGSAKVMRIVKDECRLRANSFVERIFATCAA
ncbi:transposase family protein [Bacteroides sp. UBA939]|uniref:transposase family protein n=1 Tax=Bacteroides sp. UBA939 TaxID=1946092 RepID=UPI0025B928C8|nr:transposase family protein [Bacteroides sp. UBA939]